MSVVADSELDEAPIVQTRSGPVEGYFSGDLSVFKGIPYAAAPTGDLRWAAPQPHPGWNDIRQCKRSGSIAHQPAPEFEILKGNLGSQSEDCLFLNIWTPACDNQKRAVMVWIHGGAFVTGAGSTPLYNGKYLAARDVVVVTINYRLGAFGFVNLAKATDGAIGSSGNEGLLDQVQALKWVQDNIEAFGGDPSNVTIFGESAGGMSVGNLLTMPAAKGLFHKAIPQSGACHTANPLPRGEDVAQVFMQELGADPTDAGQLRDKSAAAVSSAQLRTLARGGPSWSSGIGTMAFQPVIDGTVVEDLPITQVRKGAADGVKVMVGTTLNEFHLFGGADPRNVNMSDGDLTRYMRSILASEDPWAMITAYREALKGRAGITNPSNRDVYLAFRTDHLFRMQAIRLAEAVAERGGDAYLYQFTWESPLMAGTFKSCHALELGFMFGTHKGKAAQRFFGNGPKARGLSDAMISAWTNFAKTGNPSGGPAGDWFPYNSESRPTMIFGEKQGMRFDPYAMEREAWADVSDLVIGKA